MSTFAFVIVVLGHVFKEGLITRHRIQGAIAAYLLIVLTFALAYFLLEFLNPGSFQFASGPVKLDSQSWRFFYYLSVTTLTTLGYGDITPVQPIARNLAIAEAIVGQLYPAILLAYLVSMHTQTQRAKQGE